MVSGIYMNNTSLNEDHDLTVKGIGGWLILVAIGVVINPLILLSTLILDHLPIILDGTLFKLLHTQILLFGLMIFEIALNVIFLIYSIIIVFKFFKKSFQFPKLQIILYISNILFLIIDNVLASLIMKNVTMDMYILRLSLTAIIWSTYLLKSERVKNTFINS